MIFFYIEAIQNTTDSYHDLIMTYMYISEPKFNDNKKSPENEIIKYSRNLFTNQSTKQNSNFTWT